MQERIQGFPLEIYLVHTVGETTAKLEREFYYIDAAGVRHVSQPHMCTDGLSIPRFLWRIFGAPFASKYLAAGIIHDSECYDAEKEAKTGNVKKAKAMRLAADKNFYEMLRFMGCNQAQAWSMYRGVRIGALSLRKY